MAGNPPDPGSRHFSGVHVRMVVEYLRDHRGPDVLHRVLKRASETRPVDVLLDDTVWASYDEIRSLFEATAEVLGGPAALTEAALATPVASGSSVEMAHTLHEMGSPDSLLEAAFDTGVDLGLSTIRRRSGERVGSGEWLLHEWFTDGFESFREFCAFSAGLQSLMPRLFGISTGESVEESCCCDGADVCTFRLKWSEGERSQRERDYFEVRSRLLESRLETLQQTVAGLVSAPDPDAGLALVIDALSRAVYAQSYVLVTDPDQPVRPRLVGRGLSDEAAGVVGAELFTAEGRAARGRLCAEVVSNRTRYGWLAAIDPGGRGYLRHDEEVIGSYAALAAAALDAASAVEATERALEEARRQATTSATLLDLSKELAGMREPEQMASYLAQAVRLVVDCDSSLVFLADGEIEIAAVDGFPEPVAAALLRRRLPMSGLAPLGRSLRYLDAAEAASLCSAYGLPADQVPVATASLPMVANDQVLGALVVSVTTEPDRLRENADLSDLLEGIAGQGAVALANARLLGRIRYQALHDELTGLGNRALLIDTLDKALDRARQLDAAVAAMFIDLDGFKQINDTLGHAAGDELLAQLGSRLQGVLRSGDIVGRIGGDEFVAVLEGRCLEGGPEAIAERVMAEVRRPFRLTCVPDHELTVTASIGIAAGNRASADEMLRDADLALYRAKASGKDCHVVFSTTPAVPDAAAPPPDGLSTGAKPVRPVVAGG